MKSFKKILAVALAAVMALAVFTACGVDKSGLKDEIHDQTKLTYASALENNSAFQSVKKVVDKLDKDDDEDDVESKIKAAVKTANAELTEGDTYIYYATDGNEKDLAKDIKNQVKDKGYTYFGICSYNGHKANKSDNAVVVIASTKNA